MESIEGRQVTEDGRLIYAWPPEGRFAAPWERIAAACPTDDERCEAVGLLAAWMTETSTLVAYEDENGDLIDVEPDWDIPTAWLI